ncbi:PREDICTED: uncharacterized protein LOC100636127 [Amphimedon queenslandica]|uniref:Death domain-containing protein n=1 Tax=Amphimedon queenslandica TaxID=400682 RepID=A0AAN0JPB7_AMPQE|nr:PREDICTED: uncharacterized protein LOC100636127 [Amphimedon queenslandica]|eukprot:XP_019858668.1 PREDICTED: uncharacterized protein LOC100636127 [Amphimedon queenslandica]
MASSKPARMFPIILDISKLNEIVQILKQYRFPEAKWFEFGVNLGLLYPELEAIDVNHRGNISRCLMECLSKWLSKAHHPTWQTLASALKKIELKTVAEKIEKTMVDTASQLLQYYSSKISGATLSEESVDLLHTEGLISEETLREVKSCGYTLTDDAMRGIYTAVAYDHNKLKSFASILLRSTGTASPNLTSAASVKDVMKVVKTKCNVINIAPVKEVVSFYSITEANPLISDYSTTLDELCHKLKLQFLLDKKLSMSDFLICETIEFVLDWDPAEHLLNDIRRLMEKVFKGLSRRIIVKSMHKGNSIIIICGAPTHLMNALQLRARDNLTVLQEEFALMQLKIGHCKVYDRTIRNKELKIVAEEIEMHEGELIKINPCLNDKESLLDDQVAQLIPLKQKQGKDITLHYNH